MSVMDYLNKESTKPYSFFAGGNDLALALGLVAIVALMVLPISSWLLDILVAVNIVFGLLLVLMAIYIGSPLQFSVFPSILLISTLYRLALSIATTRMILLNGDAGSIIDAFGDFVAGGNIIVGLVVFLIITIVQFVVIAKGAERVAEVSARFSLDAMPGKQMSIDSDLRSGLVSKNEAKKKRQEIELEAKLHGSMDGAMKFVKGDAIAGIIIIIVNLIGGLAVGVLQLEMEVGQAMEKYSILTVGDGMVAQIPALLGALSAGLIVTRVSDSNNSDNLGDSIRQQFSAVPRASLIAGVLCFLLGLVPGFPSATFFVLGLLLSVISLLLMPTWKRRIDDFIKPALSTVFSEKTLPAKQRTQAGMLENLTEPVPLLLVLSQGWSTNLIVKELITDLVDIQEQLQRELGIPMPEIKLHWLSEQGTKWKLFAYEVPIATANDDETTVDIKQLVFAIDFALRRHARSFVGLQETANLVNSASGNYPDIVREALRLVPMQNIAAILGNLVEESIPIRNLRAILEALVEIGQSEKDINNLTEHVRVALRAQISHRVAPSGKLKVLTLDPELESYIAEHIRVGNGRVELAIDPREGERLIYSLTDAIHSHRPDTLVTNIKLRKCVRMLIETQCFDTPVLSQNELMRNLKIDVVACVSMPKQDRLQSVS